MKNGFIYLIFLLSIFACHDPDPMDNPDDPIDTILLQIQEKWLGDYIGDRIEEHIYKQDTTIDTLHNLILKLKSITRDSMYAGTIDFIFESQSNNWHPLYTQTYLALRDSIRLTYVLGSYILDVDMDGIYKTINTSSGYTPPAPYPVADYYWGFYRKVE